jgi:hypothetical protein
VRSASCYSENTPILLDVDGSGFALTDAENGVHFEIQGNGGLPQVAWTAPGSTNGWLALDRNGNGRIDSGRELFGDMTDQPDPPKGQERNGFLALAVFDQPANGGNSDGWISKEDAVFSRLVVWQDVNHNWVSDPGELHLLSDFGIVAISLSYKLSPRTDQFGNRFRYRALVRDLSGSTARVAWDVILVVGSSDLQAEDRSSK